MKRLLTLLASFRAAHLLGVFVPGIVLGCGPAISPAAANELLPTLVWTTPSTNAAGSMPVGNGDLGLNDWVEPDGDLFLYVGKTDAWDGFGRLLKLGRLRLALTPNPFLTGQPFRQELVLRNGAVEITAGSPGQQVNLRVWVDANRPMAHVEVLADHDVALAVSLESWRTEKRPLTSGEGSGFTDGWDCDGIIAAYVGLPDKARKQVEFKLHAPLNTTVECVYREGKVRSFKVNPESRAADVVLSLPEGGDPAPTSK